MWNYIDKLPIELVGQKVLGLLSLKDLVNLDSALLNKTVRSDFLTILQHCLPLNYDPRLAGYQWLKKRNCRISCIKLSLNQKDCFDIDTSIVEKLKLVVNRIPTLLDINQLQENHTVSKITSIHIYNMEGNNGTVINQMISILSNLNTIILSASEESHLTWLCDMKTINTNIEEVIIFTPVVSYDLANFITQCKKLKRLEILNVVSWEEDPNIFLENVGRNCSDFEYFKTYNPSSTLIDDTGIIALAHGCPNLHTLLLSFASALTDRSIIAVAQHCPKFKALTLHDANKLTSASLIAISKHRLPINSLDIPWIPIDSVEVAAQCAHALSRITNLPVSNESVQVYLPYMTSLTRFTIRNSMDASHTEAVLTAITAHCRQLHTVAICGRTEAILQQLIALACNNPYLTSVCLNEATALTDSLLAELAKHCPKLTNIDISNSLLLTDTGLIALSESCLQLNSIEFENCTQIGDALFSVFLQNCLKLGRIRVRACPLFSDSSLLALSAHSRQLNFLFVRNCGLITEAAIVELVQNCHKLSLLWVPSAVLSEFTKWQLLSQRNSNLYRTGHAGLTIYLT